MGKTLQFSGFRELVKAADEDVVSAGTVVMTVVHSIQTGVEIITRRKITTF